MDFSPSLKELHLRAMVELGGGIFKAHWDAKMPGIEPLVLFNSPKTNTTLGLRISKLSASAVREQIRKSDEAFELYAEKACTRVLGQFTQTALDRNRKAEAA